MSLLIFSIVIFLVVTQRFVELIIAKRNTTTLLREGAVEFGGGHYWVMITLHSVFFVSLVGSAILSPVALSPHWKILSLIFVLTQIFRFWIISSMSGRWTTRIIVIPGKKRIAHGPFRFVPHPNYLIVAIELLVLPLIFSRNLIALIFFILNAIVILVIRLPKENQALAWAESTPYLIRK